MKQTNSYNRTSTRDTLRILHVTESMGSGVEAVIGDYARNSSKYEHHLLFSTRGFRTGESVHEFASTSQVNGGKIALAQGLRASIRSIQPDILHLHSSWAGVFGRLTAASKREYAIVYSPHSFYFSRTDLSVPIQKFAHVVEKLLVQRTDCLAAVSPFEGQQAERLCMKAVVVPQVIPLDLLSIVRYYERDESVPLVIATVGRICRQKDPRFFMEAKAYLDERGVFADWIWIGDGVDKLRTELISAGVKVTGWLDRDKVLLQLSQTDLYVHTAAWEGAPISVLEVEALGIPTVARSIPSMESLGFPSGIRTPRDLGVAVSKLLASAKTQVATPIPIAEAKEQEQALIELYEGALQAKAASSKGGVKKEVHR